MLYSSARVLEVTAGDAAGRAVRLACPARAVPAAGRYLAAWNPQAPGTPLAHPLFLSVSHSDGFLTAPPVPLDWEPGSQLELRGPLGRGFKLAPAVRRLALAVLGDTSARLRPLMEAVLQQRGSVALFTDAAITALPVAVEINPLRVLADGVEWADFLALDLPAGRVPDLRELLKPEMERGRFPCPAQALVTLPMPCSGMGECGACAVLVRRSWRLACQDGPVFPLQDLL